MPMAALSNQGGVQPAVCRILMPTDRAREGLRIIEEWCRFGLNSPQLSGECATTTRASWHSPELRAARDAW